MLKSESYKKGIIVSTMLNVIVKSLYFFNTVIIAWYFGTSIDTDIYFYIYSSIVLIAGFINGMDAAVIIPEGMHLKQTEGESSAREFYNYFGWIYLFVGLAMFLLFLFFAVPITAAVSSYSQNDLINHRSLLLLSSCLPVLIILTNYMTGVLASYRYFTVPVLANGAVQLAGLLFLVAAHKTIGIQAIIIGMLVGYVLNFIMLVVFMRSKLNWNFSFRKVNPGPRIKKHLLTVQLGNLATFSSNYGIIVLLTGLTAGVYTAYNYSMQIVGIFIVLVISQASSIAGIKYNELAAKGEYTALNKIFKDSTGAIIFLIVPFCLLTWLYAEDGIGILLHRGIFSKEAAANVIFFTKHLVFLLPCMAINTFITRLLIANKKVNESFYFQVVFNLFLLALLFFAVRFFVLRGFICAMLGAYYSYIIIGCIILTRWLLPFLDYISFLKTVLKIILINIPIFLVSILLFDYLFYILPVVYALILIVINSKTNMFPVLTDYLFRKKNVLH